MNLFDKVKKSEEDKDLTILLLDSIKDYTEALAKDVDSKTEEEQRVIANALVVIEGLVSYILIVFTGEMLKRKLK